ncbi:hypothetical protein O3M35_011469 [Rhynocoris fuscipes]|uniref:Uncharacterized protein n=1 Tax=Rhynocoris fuscipes TaxID=488301 RepID=A0AAW1CVV6_9HEMI
MALKLDDLISKKKEVVQILDLSKVTAHNEEEFKRIMEKVPEFRIKPEKIQPEDVKLYEITRKSKRRRKKKSTQSEYSFANPIPEEMQGVKLADLCPVNIQWNMLTTLRPKSKIDTEYFSRLVELGKLQIATQEKEKKNPDSSFMRKMKNRAGVVETRYISCPECGDDFCQTETCTLLQYENFRREPVQETLGKKDEEKRGRKLNRKKKRKPIKRSKSSKSTSRTRDRSKSKSGNRHRSGSRSKSRSRQQSKSGERKSATKKSGMKKRSPSPRKKHQKNKKK